MAGYTKLSEDGYSLYGIEPSELQLSGDFFRKMFWTWVVEIGLKQKDRDLSKGLDKNGKALRQILPATRKHRRSEMTPSGKGDPSAPPLIPGWQKSRVRSLLTGKAEIDHAEFWWKYDPHSGDSFARILEAQAEAGRDVFGLSPGAIKRTQAQAWERWAKYKKGEGVEPVLKVLKRPEIPEIPVIGRGPEEWEKFWRETAKATIKGRPLTPKVMSQISGPKYNRLLAQIWGVEGPPAGGRIKVKPPKPGPIVPKVPVPPPPPIAKLAPIVPKPILPPVAIAPKQLQPLTIPVGSTLDITNAGANQAHAERVIPAIEKIHRVGPLPRIPLLPAASPGNQGDFNYFLTGKPRSIGLRPDGETPGLTLAHEIGHFIEGFAIPGGDGGKRQWKGLSAHPIMERWQRAIQESEAFKTLDSLVVSKPPAAKTGQDLMLEYLLRWDELWARSYAQWVATRSNDPILKGQLESARNYNQQISATRQWSDNDFIRIGRAIDIMFKELGWMEEVSWKKPKTV